MIRKTEHVRLRDLENLLQYIEGFLAPAGISEALAAAKLESRVSAQADLIFTLPKTSLNNYTNNKILIGQGECHWKTSGLTGKSMA